MAILASLYKIYRDNSFHLVTISLRHGKRRIKISYLYKRKVEGNPLKLSSLQSQRGRQNSTKLVSFQIQLLITKITS